MQTGLQTVVGASRDGARGAARGAVDALSLGLATSAFDRKFGARDVALDRGLAESKTNVAISIASNVAGGMYGARVLGATALGGTATAVAVGAASWLGSVLKTESTRDVIAMKPETDKDRADVIRAHRALNRRETGGRFSERLDDKAAKHRAVADIAGGVRSGAQSVGTINLVFGNFGTAASAYGVALGAQVVESSQGVKADRLRRRAVAIDYMARRQRQDNTSGLTLALGQNASIAASKRAKAAPPYSGKTRTDPYVDRLGRNYSSGRAIPLN